MKKVLVFLLAATFGMAGSALAFHEGGVGQCEGCHTMHNSNGGVAMTMNGTAIGTANAFLLQGSDQSSTCLNCHGEGTTNHSYHVATAGATTDGSIPAQFGPGGDFSWITASTVDGQNLGHNIVAADYNGGLLADTTLTTAPGGTFDANNLACSSCHDPHGKYRILDDGTVATGGAPIVESGSYGAIPAAGEAVGVYRLLGGKSFTPESTGYAFDGATDPPVAVAPNSYNNTTTVGGATVAYGSGMSEWCANCHAQMHNDAYPTNLRHPAGNGATLPADIVANYNNYVKSGDMSGGTYLALVPFETGKTSSAADRTALAALAATPGLAATTDNVMCLSCHRAHASGFPSMLRWNQDNEFITDASGAYTVNAGLGTAAQAQAAYYNTPASTWSVAQRSLCNKCHAKD